MKAKVDKDICIGCGMCVDICPEVFKMDYDERAIVIADTTTQTYDEVQDAMISCPVAAISEE